MSATEVPEVEATVPEGGDRLLGRRVRGPSALGGDRRRFVTLTVALAVTDFKLRFFGTALGYLWQLMRPLALFGVLYVIFSVVLALDDAPFYAEALLLGLVLYTFLGDATKGSVSSIVNRESLVRKIEFPRLAVPLSVVLTALFNLVMNLLPVFVFLLIDGGQVRWSWLELPLLIAALAVFSTGLAMLLSSLYVRYRDVDPIWEV
ncbi:MAG: ABC transporter permease, partial [Solirubrobacterales bacterium]|nr:ABC transporter permease [Solirubrobacterales bacterium]